MEELTIYDRMTVTVPEGELERMRVERFTVTQEAARGVAAFRLALTGRGIRPGTYTRLTEDDCFWMSDTPAEKADHYEAVRAIKKLQAKRVLINGLGIGMVLQAALSFDHVEHVDVVEIDERVIGLVGPHYEKDPRVTIHHADAYEQAKRWAPGTRWDVGWSDIWPTLCSDNLSGHARLNRSYGRRCQWHGCWVHDTLVYQREKERREDARCAAFFG